MIEKQQIGTWTDTLASKAPVPGGGGASALGGALGYGCFRLLCKAAPGVLGRFRRKKPEGQTVPR